jgi:hypothetical protein
MHTGVGAPCRVASKRLIGKACERPFKAILDGIAARLRLPSGPRASIVLDAKRDPLHGRRRLR